MSRPARYGTPSTVCGAPKPPLPKLTRAQSRGGFSFKHALEQSNTALKWADCIKGRFVMLIRFLIAVVALMLILAQYWWAAGEDWSSWVLVYALASLLFIVGTLLWKRRAGRI